MNTTASSTPGHTLSQDVRTIALIGLVHGCSHFFHLLMPPLFPFLITEFGYSYSELGLLLSVFFVVSGVGQALSGFLVDRVGARPVLFAALSCFILAGLLAGNATGYVGLVLASALAGLGNAPFHPVDFTILNQRVSPKHLGHGFSVHGISGNLGWAAAPVFMTGITAWTGSWRMACLAAAALAMVVLAIALWQRSVLGTSHAGRSSVSTVSAAKKAAPVAAGGVAHEHPLAFLKLPSVWLCFSFFFWSTCALSAIQSFAGPALHTLYDLPLALTAMVVTAYMLCSAAGMVVGGFLVSRVERLEKIISLCLIASAVALVVVASGVLPGMLAFALTALSGIGIGLANPSRDMLIKRAAPAGATGRVYGTVYSGLDLGFCVAAPVFGALMDAHLYPAIFAGSALALVLGVASAGWVGITLAARTRLAKAVA